MATIDATVGGASANSYVTVAEATSYFDARLNADAWTADATKQIPALIMATLRIDQELYQGSPTSTTQRRKFPRMNMVDPETDLAIDSATIPNDLKDAVCELALHLLRAGTSDPTAPTGLEIFDALSVGDLSLTPAKIVPQLPPQVTRLLRKLRTGGSGLIPLPRA